MIQDEQLCAVLILQTRLVELDLGGVKELTDATMIEVGGWFSLGASVCLNGWVGNYKIECAEGPFSIKVHNDASAVRVMGS